MEWLGTNLRRFGGPARFCQPCDADSETPITPGLGLVTRVMVLPPPRARGIVRRVPRPYQEE